MRTCQTSADNHAELVQVGVARSCGLPEWKGLGGNQSMKKVLSIYKEIHVLNGKEREYF